MTGAGISLVFSESPRRQEITRAWGARFLQVAGGWALLGADAVTAGAARGLQAAVQVHSLHRTYSASREHEPPHCPRKSEQPRQSDPGSLRGGRRTGGQAGGQGPRTLSRSL